MSFSLQEYEYHADKLGRSTAFINATKKYAENLIGKGLPVIFTSHHLCNYLGFHYKDFEYLLENRADLYKYYEIKKRNGGTRQIMAPYSKIRSVQQFVNTEILEKIPVSPQAFGFVKGRSILQNAQRHSEKAAILNIDLAKFFDCITEKRIYGIFRSLGYSANLAVDLAKIVTVTLPESYLLSFSEEDLLWYNKLVPKGTAVLPQGAPTSPILSNLILRRLDKRLNKLSEVADITYTRYADDMTFSGKFEELPRKSIIRRIVNEEGFEINWSKVSIYKKGRKQMVTGLTVSDGVHIHRNFKKEIKKHLYCCKKFGVRKHLKHIGMEGVGLYKEWLLGKIYFVRSVEKESSDKLLEMYSVIDWPV